MTSPDPAKAPRSRRKAATRRGRLGRGRREGASAVEFALVAFPFFFMMFAIIELGVIFVTDSILENAVLETSRLVRTGQADGSAMTAAQFKTELCNRMSIFKNDCPARLTTDVRDMTQFRNANPPDPMAGSSFNSSSLTYLKGQPGSLMLVRGWYRQPLFTPFLAQALSKMGDGATILTVTAAFRNEPYNE